MSPALARWLAHRLSQPVEQARRLAELDEDIYLESTVSPFRLGLRVGVHYGVSIEIGGTTYTLSRLDSLLDHFAPLGDPVLSMIVIGIVDLADQLQERVDRTIAGWRRPEVEERYQTLLTAVELGEVNHDR